MAVLMLALSMLLSGVQGEPRIVEDISAIMRREGEDGYLDCTVENLDGHKVTWMKQDLTKGTLFALNNLRPEGFSLVSMGTVTMNSDPHISVRVIQTSNPQQVIYRLLIKSLTKEHGGDYRCIIQIPFKPWDECPYKDSFILVKPNDIHAKLPEFYGSMPPVQARVGEAVNFNCTVKNTGMKSMIWFVKVTESLPGYDRFQLLSIGDSVQTQTDLRKRYMAGKMTYTIGEDTYDSVLLKIKKVKKADAGTYRCMIHLLEIGGPRFARNPHIDTQLIVK